MFKVGDLIIRKRGKSYEYRFEVVGRSDENGNYTRKWITKAGFRLKREAVQCGNEAREEFVRTKGKPMRKQDNISFSTLVELFLQHALLTMEPTTHGAYQSSLYKHCIPIIGEMAVVDIDYNDIEVILANANDLGLSASRIDGIHAALTSCFNFAMRQLHLIRENPVPLAAYVVNNNIPEIREPYTLEQVQMLLDYVKDNDLYRILVLLSCHCGMRLGEELGLCWDQVDLHNKKLTIANQISNGRYKGESFQIFKQPKSIHSIRTITFNDEVKNELLFLKRRQMEDAQRFGEEYIYPQVVDFHMGKRIVKKIVNSSENVPGGETLALVCRQRSGRTILSRTIDSFYNTAGKRLGFKATSHRGRHTAATLMIENGVPFALVGKRLGHSPNSPNVTNGYIHLTTQYDEKLANQLSDMLKKIN